MDLRQLKTFLHVAELGSLSRAADRLNTAQPALGRQIRLLEEELGGALFSRHGRGMVLTDTGSLLVERATAILRMVEDTREELTASLGAVSGAVSLGVPPTAGEVISGRLVERFLRDYPQVTVRIVPAFSGYLSEMLQRGEIDLAVMYQTSAIRHIPAEPLIQETLFLVGAAGSELDLEIPRDFASLADLPLVLPGPRHGLRILLENAARQAGIALRVTVEADALQTLKELAARGLAHTVLPLPAIHPDLRAGTLRAAPIANPTLDRRLVLARSIVRPASRAVRVFADTLRAETADMVRDGIWQGELLLDRAPRSG
ncbi:LysR family transcriptional regulator [Thalassobaculum litoreum]|uniref:DNA-binding transcriptional regulator, LysR family n=1 Tax=Thalassobaculum litoreum DSM 18839 TaxID=1123362 RepID=A0A8G2BGU5_9PROT|nr:LysR substrate-binding domain-containing protein [Thalassobaculum litoreum]SDF50416.1 DNA-binding transcriptional regulator, LysR family [Thalassobaculum litoreum DSM 18839]